MGDFGSWDHLIIKLLYCFHLGVYWWYHNAMKASNIHRLTQFPLSQMTPWKVFSRGGFSQEIFLIEKERGFLKVDRLQHWWTSGQKNGKCWSSTSNTECFQMLQKYKIAAQSQFHLSWVEFFLCLQREQDGLNVNFVVAELSVSKAHFLFLSYKYFVA